VLALHQLQLPAEQRMERMSDSHPLLVKRPTRRNRGVSPNPGSKEPFRMCAGTSSRGRRSSIWPTPSVGLSSGVG
jgi:hypothetical protein